MDDGWYRPPSLSRFLSAKKPLKLVRRFLFSLRCIRENHSLRSHSSGFFPIMCLPHFICVALTTGTQPPFTALRRLACLQHIKHQQDFLPCFIAGFYFLARETPVQHFEVSWSVHPDPTRDFPPSSSFILEGKKNRSTFHGVDPLGSRQHRRR